MTHYVYFIQTTKERSPIKIGHAANVEKRMADLQAGNPHKLEIKIKIPFSSKLQAASTEKLFHKQGERHHRRLTGEWFYIEGSLAEFIGRAIAYREEMNTKDKRAKTSRRKPRS